MNTTDQASDAIERATTEEALMKVAEEIGKDAAGPLLYLDVRAALAGQRVPEELRKLSEAATQSAAATWPSAPMYIRADDNNGWGLLTAFHKKPGEAEANAAFMVACWNYVRSLISTSPAVADGGWKDIASAPKGRWVLVWREGWRTPERGRLRSVWGEPASWETERGGGWPTGHEPTHWRDIPAPPQHPTAPGHEDGR